MTQHIGVGGKSRQTNHIDSNNRHAIRRYGFKKIEIIHLAISVTEHPVTAILNTAQHTPNSVKTQTHKLCKSNSSRVTLLNDQNIIGALIMSAPDPTVSPWDANITRQNDANSTFFNYIAQLESTLMEPWPLAEKVKSLMIVIVRSRRRKGNTGSNNGTIAIRREHLRGTMDSNASFSSWRPSVAPTRYLVACTPGIHSIKSGSSWKRSAQAGFSSAIFAHSTASFSSATGSPSIGHPSCAGSSGFSLWA